MYKWPKVHEKVLNTTNYQGNANQTMRCHFTPIRTSFIKGLETSVGKDAEQNGTLMHSWWKCKLVQLL